MNIWKDHKQHMVGWQAVQAGQTTVEDYFMSKVGLSALHIVAYEGLLGCIAIFGVFLPIAQVTCTAILVLWQYGWQASRVCGLTCGCATIAASACHAPRLLRALMHGVHRCCLVPKATASTRTPSRRGT